jgi:acetoacetyl-CoA reductase
VIAPGYTDTAMVGAVRPDVLEQILKTVPAGRLATAEEVARCAVFLAADAASFITGVTLSINGGKYMA